MLLVAAEHHQQAALFTPPFWSVAPLLQVCLAYLSSDAWCSFLAGSFSLPVQRPPGVASAAGPQLAASTDSAAGLLAAPADAGPAV